MADLPSTDVLSREPGEPPVQQHLPPPGQAHTRVVRLSEAERAASARALAEWLDGSTAELDSIAFFDSAEVAEGVLPQRARAALAELRRGAVTAVILRNLPYDEEIGPTPRSDEDLVAAPRTGHAILAACVRRLGHEVAYETEKHGAVVHNIHPTRSGAATQSNASWQVNLSLHTENAFHAIRPDFIVLHGLRSPQRPPATVLSFIDDVVAELTDQQIAILRATRFTVGVAESFRSQGEPDAAVPIRVLSGSSREPLVRWHDSVRGTDRSAVRAGEALARAAARVSRRFPLERGDLLAFANHRCLHGRDRFDAQLDGDDRWLLRAYVVLDRLRLGPFVSSSDPHVLRMDISAGPASDDTAAS